MIIVNLKGGLGNQMFQYATGLAISLDNNDILKLSDHSYKANPIRQYRLNNFNIASSLCSKEELIEVKYPSGIFSKARRFIMGRYIHHYAIKNYYQKYTKYHGKLFLDGFWQTEKYFKHHRGEILRQFTSKNPVSEKTREWLNILENDPKSVSIHFRRTDYVNNSTHDTKDTEYHYRAMNFISKKIDSPNIYVFSDDPEWVKENNKFNSSVFYVSDKKIEDYEELILMSKCRHNIIMNSSFSWWGAWLNTNPDKIVCAPKKWANGKKDREFRDIVPDDWIRI